jgi:hypothetical protein
MEWEKVEFVCLHGEPSSLPFRIPDRRPLEFTQDAPKCE